MTSRRIVYKIERKDFDGYCYPVDEVGHAGIVEYDEDKDLHYLTTTDPYHDISYAVGDDDDFVCFDFLLLEAHVALHSTVNSETGGFIQTLEYGVFSYNDAIEAARSIVDTAHQWCGDNEVLENEDETGSKFIEDVQKNVEKRRSELE